MNIHRYLRLPLATAALALAGACGRSEAAPPQPAAAAAAVASRATEEASATRVPTRIYYDLTRFEWYRRGQPLVIDGIGYDPAGPPVRVPAAGLQRLGTYEGVDYYRQGDSSELVFVPVYPGYWQPFSPDRASAATDE